MGTRSMNYIALQPDVKITEPFAKFITGKIAVDNDDGKLIVYQSNFSPMFARGLPFGSKLDDLEEELIVQRFLNSLPDDSFYMKRAGDECDWRGGWTDHPFYNNEDVMEIEETYEENTRATDSKSNDESISVPREMLASLIDMANDHTKDIETGIEEGIYCASENPDITKKRETVDAADALYREATLGESDSHGMQ